METLDARARSAHTTARLRTPVLHGGRLATSFVRIVSGTKLRIIDERFESMDAPGTLNLGHGVVDLRVQEPKERRHWRAVA